MASINAYRTANGERRYEVRYWDAGGRHRSRVFSVRKDAQAFKLDVERKRQAGILYQAPPERFGDISAAWLERFVIGAAGRVRPRPKTIRTAEDCLRYLAPLNDLAIERIRRPLVEDLLADIASHAPRRAEMTFSLLKRLLKWAEDRGQQVDRAIYGIRIAKADEREPRFLTWEEVEELQSWMHESICRIVPVAVLTLLRRGEILGLRDRDIDFDTGSIGVLAQRQDGERVTTKTRAGRRTIDVGPQVLKLLREQQLARPATPDGYLFPSPSGAPSDGDNFFARVFKPAACNAGMPELTFHDLRHTGASLMIASGCHVKVIAEQMGHSDGGALVLRRYGHLYKGAKRQAAMALESHVFKGRRDSDVRSTSGEMQLW
ncbi:MAG TPA: site-specific integrase [Gaiellaceae bacterium]|nr:site-specific integrase [Gaiellaceae bacterium]